MQMSGRRVTATARVHPLLPYVPLLYPVQLKMFKTTNPGTTWTQTLHIRAHIKQIKDSSVFVCKEKLCQQTSL